MYVPGDCNILIISVCDLCYKKKDKWKSGVTDIINHNFARIRTDSYNSLPIEQTLTFHIMLKYTC